ncbi:hypothetical protein CK203_099437 [Vitis vinifera]|uniref:Aspartic peptidase DDI1-type domain-containing protein n=1 Tax=Vitis vinifera TaxID=29760 RepID=A0A438BN32_VITVI|nr:hypothetical protein CK203_099437 [Vitis vinifera]
MTRRLEELELKKIHEVQAVAETPVQVKPCPICQSYEHLVEECPTIPAAREMLEIKQMSLDNSSPTTMLHMEILTTQIGGTIQISHGSQETSVRDVKALITLRSGKKVELPTPKPHVEKEEEEETEKREEIKGKKKDSSEGKVDHDSTVKQIRRKSGLPTISVMIGGTVVEKALLDLGASVNLLPYSVYKQLGLVDFVVLDTDPIVKETNYVPIILGRPFLATSNAIINCRNGLMQLTFGNMTLELNIFYMSKKPITPEEEEGPEEVCIIDTLVEEHCNQKMQDKLNESLGDLEEGLPEPSDVLATLQGWRRREEILPLFNKEEAQEAAKEETPKLNLKPLPTELKYTYLEENKKCPVVISSSLTTPQEMCLLEVLKRCKKAIGWQISDLKGISPLVVHIIYTWKKKLNQFINLKED